MVSVKESQASELPFNRTDIIACSETVAERLTDEHVKLLDYMASGLNTEHIQVYGAEPLHVGYFGKAKKDLDSSALHHVQKNGYCVIHAGRKTSPKSDEKRSWMEFRPRSYYEENYW